MELAGMGQYAHGNQPIQHAIYLYNYAQQPLKTQEKVRYKWIIYMEREQMVIAVTRINNISLVCFSSLGLSISTCYRAIYFGESAFREVEIDLNNGKTLRINAKNNSENNIFIDSFKFNQLESNKNWVDHKDLRNGGVIDLECLIPQFDWGSAINSVPFSMTKIK